jgi:phage terminase small subunit
MGEILTPKQEAFSVGLAEGLSQAAAYRQAYPKSRAWQDATVWRKASLLASHGDVQARVSELRALIQAESVTKLKDIAAELHRLSFFDVRKLVRDDGTPLPLRQLDDDTARAIVGLDVVSVGNADIGIGQVLKFKLADKGANLERLAKLLGYFERDNKQRNPLGNFSPQQFFADIFRRGSSD